MAGDWTFARTEVALACRVFGTLLKLDGVVDLYGNPLDGPRAMWAFALQESFHPDRDHLSCPPRFEPAYFTGRYAKQPWQAGLNAEFGEDGAKSYGCWQVMLCNAKGFKPSEFHEMEKGAVAFIGHVNRVIESQKPRNLMELADAYNSGNAKDWNIPDQYIKRVVEFYHDRDGKNPMPGGA